ncbi:MAG TPA: dienelactone hydrolase family protein [Candidatus Limnocylindrales bacterium]|nr:dienelactone hydrolase family protein [Candidatus Limnocylindrales bacterium]
MLFRPNRRQKYVWSSLTVIILFLSLLFLSTELYKERDFSQIFLDRKGSLVEIEERSLDPKKYEIRLRSSNGLTVEGFIKIPDSSTLSAPAVIVFNGLETGAWVVDLIGGVQEVEETVIMAMNYPYKGEVSLEGAQLLLTLLQFRQAIFDTVVGGLLMVDYLTQRKGVDPERITMVGISFGSPFAVVVSALDPRIRGVAIHYGGGDLEKLLFHNIQSGNWISRKLLSSLGALILAPIEPLKYIDRIAPRPLFMINGEQDERIPQESARTLFQKAHFPKEMVWLESDHVYPSKTELIQELTRRTAQWMKKNHLLKVFPK